MGCVFNVQSWALILVGIKLLYLPYVGISKSEGRFQMATRLPLQCVLTNASLNPCDFLKCIAIRIIKKISQYLVAKCADRFVFFSLLDFSLFPSYTIQCWVFYLLNWVESFWSELTDNKVLKVWKFWLWLSIFWVENNKDWV